MPISHHWVVSRVIFCVDSHEMTASGWSCRFEPTPGESTRTSMPTSRRWSAGPMPESISSLGESIAPAERITSRRACMIEERSKALSMYSTPVARCSSSKSTRMTCRPVRTCRFSRSMFGCR